MILLGVAGAQRTPLIGGHGVAVVFSCFSSKPGPSELDLAMRYGGLRETQVSNRAAVNARAWSAAAPSAGRAATRG